MGNLYRIAYNGNQTKKHKFITVSKKNYNKLYPNRNAKKISYFFLKDYVLLLSVKIAEYIISEYQEMVVYDRFGNIISNNDYLDNLTKDELLFESQKYHIEYLNKSDFEIKLNILEKMGERKQKTAYIVNKNCS
ncbi:MAG: hypothetical protein U9N34_10655 [Candidatus Cloacimonadota bacterium]|nr:hypothetical protein [Candidatus Cloacimonadota bacterium]